MKWKNGKGITEEIALYPANASLDSDAIQWRLSLAPILEDGPFSLFPGLERYLALVEGKALQLDFGKKQVLLRRGDIYAFSGNEPVQASLPAGPVKDLGLLYRKGLKAEMNVLDFTKKPRSFQVNAPTVFFFAAAGTFAAETYPGGMELSLKEGSALRVDHLPEERIVLLEPNSAKGMIVVVEIG